MSRRSSAPDASGRGARVLLVLGGTLLGAAASLALFLSVEPYFFRTHRLDSAQVASLRKRLDESPSSLFVYDEDTQYRLKPSFVGKRQNAEWSVHRTNSLGTLGDEVVLSPGLRNLVFLGDSVTYGSGVAQEETFPSVIQRMSRPDVQVINAGTPGWSTKQEVEFYEKYLAGIRPVTVLQVFCPNDLVDYEWTVDAEGEFEMTEDVRRIGGLAGIGMSWAGLRVQMIRLGFSMDERLAPLAQMYNVFHRAWDRMAWKEYENQTLRLPQLSDDITWILVYIPIHNQIASLELGAEETEACFPQHRLAELAQRRGLPFLDATRALLGAEASDRQVLFTDAIHLSAIGHEVVAEAVVEYLRGMGVVLR